MKSLLRRICHLGEHNDQVSMNLCLFFLKYKKLAAHGGNLLENEMLAKIAESYNVTIAQLLLRYQLQRNILVIPKSKTPSRIDENAQVFHFNISDDDMAKIKGLDKNTRSCNFVINSESQNFPASWKKEQFYLDSLKV